MEARAKLFGHPIHQMLIVFPLGLLTTSVVFDLLYLYHDDSRFAQTSAWLVMGGIATGLLAAVFGLIDWLAIPSGTRAKSVGLTHALGNVLVLGLFAVSLYMRWSDPAAPSEAAIAVAGAGVLLSLVTGWLGGELVTRLSVGVDDNANLDAPSSLGASGSGVRRSTDTFGRSGAQSH